MTILGGPMFDGSDLGWCKSVSGKSGGHYNIHGSNDPIVAIVALRKWFDSDDAVNTMNFLLFSTSGVHGCYTTIEEIEASMAKYPDGPPDEDDPPEDYVGNDLTFLVVQPRIVGMKFGTCTMRDADDIAWAKRMRSLSIAAVAKIGATE